MTRFTSKRERRLWGLTFAVAVAIYSTVGVAGTLAQALGERQLLGVSFGAGFAVIIAAVVGIALHQGAQAREIWVGVGVIAVYGMIIVRMGVGPVERTHLFEYGFLAVLIHQALLERKRNGSGVRFPPAIAILGAALLGWGDEGLQAFLPNRVYDTRDVLINALAAVVATTASVVLGWLRRLAARRSEA